MNSKYLLLIANTFTVKHTKKCVLTTTITTKVFYTRNYWHKLADSYSVDRPITAIAYPIHSLKFKRTYSTESNETQEEC